MNGKKHCEYGGLMSRFNTSNCIKTFIIHREIVINSLFGAVLSFVLHIISNYSKLCKTLSKIAPLFSDGIFSDIRKPAKPWTTFRRELLGVGEQLRQNPYLPNQT